MHPSSSVRRNWDGSFVADRGRRLLRVAPDSPSRLLRCAQPGRCHACGNRIEWYRRSEERSVCLHPQELLSAKVPVKFRWHVMSGLAHPAGDGSPWCRIAHVAICPASDGATAHDSGLSDLRRALAINTRRLIDSGAFTPSASAVGAAQGPAACRPARPVVQLLYIRYLAACPVEEIQCVAQTRHRVRCPQRLLTSDTVTGTWALVPATAGQGQLALPSEVMALYDLAGLPYKEQLRWRAQRCSSHAAAPAAADLAMTDWEVFDPLLHRVHIQTRLPTLARRPRRGALSRNATGDE
ncbi:DUF6083 domain-containing protein [Streptomyces sp. IBSBF 2390]|uniref:DUF6083 domain-containing protein n=1 Tax=Streptomyces sp. IBSBF 2390 TaxID=2903533 RepID=UPI002FDC3A4E